MEIIINDHVFNVLGFMEGRSYARITYTITMNLEEADIDIIKSATQFKFVNGEQTTIYENFEFDNYSVKSDNTIVFLFFREIGARIEDILHQLQTISTNIETLSEAVDYLAFEKDEEENNN